MWLRGFFNIFSLKRLVKQNYTRAPLTLYTHIRRSHSDTNYPDDGFRGFLRPSEQNPGYYLQQTTTVSSNSSQFIVIYTLPLEIQNAWRLGLSNGPNRVCVYLPSREDENRPSFRNVLFSNIQNSGQWTKFRNPVILGVTHNRHPSDSTISVCEGSKTVHALGL
jgi:hypothetical protein